MLSTELFYLTLINSFIGCFFVYLPLYPLQVFGVSLEMFKEFKAFCPCSFTTPAVKGIDKFWKFRGSLTVLTNSAGRLSLGW